MTYNNLLITDIDDTLLHWRKAFKEYMISHGHVLGDPSDNSYIMNASFNLTFDEIDFWVRKFNSSSERFGELKPLKGSKESLNALKEQDYKIICLSSCGDSKNTKRMREDNLINVFGDIFDDIICLPAFSDKRKYLTKYDPGIWVEDNIKHAEHGYLHGSHKTFLINQPWNVNSNVDNNIIRCDDWDELLDHHLETSRFYERTNSISNPAFIKKKPNY